MKRFRLVLLAAILLVTAFLVGQQLVADNRAAARVPADLRRYLAEEMRGLTQYRWETYYPDGDVAYVVVKCGPDPVTLWTEYHLFKVTQSGGHWESQWTSVSRNGEQPFPGQGQAQGSEPFLPGSYWPMFDPQGNPTVAYGGGAVFDPAVSRVIGVDTSGRVTTGVLFDGFFWLEADLSGDLAGRLWKTIKAVDASGNVIYEGQPQYPENVVPLEFWLPR